MTILSLQTFPNCFLRFQGNTLIKKNFFQKHFLSFFRNVSSFFLKFGKTFSVKLSKLLFPCLDEHLMRSIFSESSSIYLRTLSERFSELGWKFHRKVFKNLSCVFRKHFQETDFSENLLIPMYTRTMSESVSEFWQFFCKLAQTAT